MANHPFNDSAISLESALEAIQQLENENKQLAHDLEECRDQLFDVLQKQYEIPEQRIKDDFTRIFLAIDSWIDDVSVDDRFDFKERYASNIHSTMFKDIFQDLGLKGGCLDISWAKKLGELEACHYVVLSLLVTCYVVEDIFGVGPRLKGDPFPPGIMPKQITFIEKIKNAMGSDSDTSKGDMSQYSKWRGETISALTSTDEYKEICDEEIADINESLRTELARWIDRKRLDEHFGSLLRKVLDPAYKLVHTLGRSRKTYQLRLEKATPSFVPPSDGSWDFKDMATWMIMPSSEVTGSIRYLYPGLIRKGYGNQEDLILVHPVALGYRNPDLKPRSSIPQSVSTSICPKRPNIKAVERTTTDPARTEEIRSKRDAHEALRLTNKPSRTDHTHKKISNQGIHDQPRAEYKSREGTMLDRAGEFILGRPFQSSSSKASHPAPPKNEGKRSIEPEAPRSETWHPESRASDADIRRARRGSVG
ncbi:hypothetical protein F4680DRAFT_468738 [Xylaria scruposa]|nr:hypothetical protein F4680DRAFT_468738 [Xylaria scruposa]